MIIYGWNPVREAIRAHPERVRYIGVSESHREKLQKLVEEARDAKISVRVMPQDRLDHMAGAGGVHNGVIAELTQTEYADFDAIVSAETTRFVLVLDSVQDPQNFGAVLRVADGFGVDMVVIPEHQSVSLTPAAVKASAGAAEWVSVARVTNLARAIEELKKYEFWVYAAEASGKPVDEIDLKGKVAVVLGNEGKGIRRNVLEHCDATLSIPMSGHVESLNVATAAAVVAYEVARQNRKKV